MEHRRLGRTGYKVSVIGLGSVELGMDYGIPDERGRRRPSHAEAARLLNQALDSGINFVDTARVYGASEEIIGAALKSRRREYFLASKVSAGKSSFAHDGSLRSHVSASVHQSLQALQTDVIDLMQLHSLSAEEIRRGEYTEILEEFQKSGSIRYLGATTYGEEAALAALEDGRFDCLQVAYNVLDRQLENRVLPLAEAKGIGVVVRSVLLKGALTHRYRYLPEDLNELKSLVEELSTLLDAESWNMPEFAYRFVLAHPAVSTCLVGTASVEELKATLEYAARGPLSSGWRKMVEGMSIKDRNQLDPSTWSLQERQ
jgi:1-deoxyxylulose-5-phosphate synthase